MLKKTDYEGIVTLNGFIAMQNGEEYRYLWSSDWRIQTDKQMPIENFRSSEHWQMIAHWGGDPVVVIPGCQVNAFVICDYPKVPRVFSIDHWMETK